jgi:hypothetical protein
LPPAVHWDFALCFLKLSLDGNISTLKNGS